jgi:hypothetical protein
VKLGEPNHYPDQLKFNPPPGIENYLFDPFSLIIKTLNQSHQEIVTKLIYEQKWKIFRKFPQRPDSHQILTLCEESLNLTQLEKQYFSSHTFYHQVFFSILDFKIKTVQK